MTITRFEDIEAWKLARTFVKAIYIETKKEPIRKDLRFCSQLQSAAVSMMSNIAEGFHSRSTREFIQFLSYAIRSSAEVQSLLYVGVDIGYFNKKKFDELFQQASLIAKKATAFQNYLKNYDKRSG